MKKAVAMMMTAALGVSLLAGCGSSSSAASATSETGSKVHILPAKQLPQQVRQAQPVKQHLPQQLRQQHPAITS